MPFRDKEMEFLPDKKYEGEYKIIKIYNLTEN